MNKKTLVIIGVEVLVCIIVATSYVFMHRDMKDMVAQNNIIALDIERIEASRKELESIEQNIGSTKEERDRLLEVFLSTEGTVDFIDGIEVLAKKMGVLFKVKTIVEQEDEVLREAGKGLVVFSAEAEGSWDGMLHFLKLLENLPYKSSIEAVSVSSKVDTGEDGKKAPSASWEGSVTFSVVKTK